MAIFILVLNVQIFFHILGKANWSVEPVSLATFSAPDKLRPSMDDFQSMFDVVFVDGTGYTNLTADMSSATLSVVCFSYVK